MIKYIAIILCVSVLFFSSSVASAQSTHERIAELQRQLTMLQEQLQILLDMQESDSIPAGFSFSQRLEFGDRGEDVRQLQRILNMHPATQLASTGPGSPGHETDVFGFATRSAVIAFQELYREEILRPWGFVRGTGIVGPSTIAKLNTLIPSHTNEDSFATVSSLAPRKADTIVLVATDETEHVEVTAEFLGETIHFFPSSIQGQYVAIVGINVKQAPGSYPLTIRSSSGKTASYTVSVQERSFPVTVLATTPELESRGFTPEQIQENIVSEQETMRMSEIIGTIRAESHISKPFLNPLDVMQNVGAYGNIRKQGTVSLQHLGVDLAAPVGTPAYAVNDGIVRFVGHPANYGNTLVIDHGLGIYSVYLHLDEILVQEGDLVTRGDTVAHTGNTGYSLAPHLHFSIRATGVSVDPLVFLGTANTFLQE